MTRKIVWRPMSLSDREAIMEYIANNNSAAAIALDEAFEAHAERACQNPDLYRKGRVADTREIVVRPNYVMVYGVEDEGNTVAILRVLHTAQQWPPAA